MRRIGYRIAVAATALSLGAFVGVATADDITNPTDVDPLGAGKVGFGPGCDDGHGCAWDLTNYNAFIYKWVIPNNPGYYHLVHGPAYSAKNRYGDRLLKLLRGDGTVVACLDPGENRPDPGSFHYVKVGGAGSRCG